jgi:hypothetical protein
MIDVSVHGLDWAVHTPLRQVASGQTTFLSGLLDPAHISHLVVKFYVVFKNMNKSKHHQISRM